MARVCRFVRTSSRRARRSRCTIRLEGPEDGTELIGAILRQPDPQVPAPTRSEATCKNPDGSGEEPPRRQRQPKGEERPKDHREGQEVPPPSRLRRAAVPQPEGSHRSQDHPPGETPR